MKNKQKVNKIMDLIGFLFLNLQRKILNKQRSISSSSLSLIEKSGNVILSSKGEIHNADIVVTYNDGIVMKFYSYSSVDSPMVVLSEDEIPQEGCYVKISQGDKYVLYQVTKD